ncbi:alpha/beta hydrolase family protein [Tomitella fengzijianii]|uniref:Alpha/beta fold hydrolase n=1 Tax=Tomitella fengzijianii TaxID=2597660 RepID=A0A516X377_9ACTN|nr:alpha/beta hydrolase [Tomitella fengzijianii]QDQ97536.1 alpha/beta fold hydrolase [Tomitella fengzijianii]
MSTNGAPAHRRRGQLFDSAFHDRFGQWPVGFVPAGGADMGDIVAVANAVGDGDDSAFYDAFVASGDVHAAEARRALVAGHRRSARARFLRASCMYAAAYHPIYGTPVDPRLLAAFDKQMDAFRTAMELCDPPVRPVAIPFEGGELPAYLVPAAERADQVRPLLILTNGFDATITDMYFASGVAALDRGYHVLMFDGPGQGAMLYRRGVPLRPDWETVIGAVVDFAETVPIVDRSRIALSGWSLGGYLAPRAASGEHRLAACIADPGQWDIADAIRRFLAAFGVPDADTVDVTGLDEATLAHLSAAIDADREMRWQIVQRGYWTTGVPDLRGFLRALAGFTLKDRVGGIRCPTLLTAAENDPLAADTAAFFDALTCPKALLRFTAAEGAGEHTEAVNRSLYNQRALDWLDEVLRAG